MKKISFFILAIILLFVFCGCAENNFPVSAWDSYAEQVNEAHTALCNSGIEDLAAFNKETRLVAYTVERDVPFEVVFLYDDYSGGRVSSLQAIPGVLRVINGCEYREWYKATLTLSILDALDKFANESGDIIGAIVSWKRTHIFSDDEFYSVCDLDGDGEWDYCFKSVSENVLSFVEGGGDGPSRVIGEQEIKVVAATLSNQEIVELSGLTGKETFRDIEELLKADAA